MPHPQVILVQNSPGSGPGRLPEWLAAAGVDAPVVAGADLPEHLEAWPSLVDGPVAGLVLLGGGLMPDDDEGHPWLVRERRIVTEALAAGVPVLGICLGGQVLAHVAGGEVTAKSGETEKGMCAVRLLPGSDDDPLLGALHDVADAGEVRMVESHVDSVTGLPPGAVHLATSDACGVQAFRVGDAAWGLQFHPEARPERIAGWDADELAALGFDREALAAEAVEHAATNERQARALVGAFAAVVRSRDGTHSESESGRGSV